MGRNTSLTTKPQPLLGQIQQSRSLQVVSLTVHQGKYCAFHVCVILTKKSDDQFLLTHFYRIQTSDPNQDLSFSHSGRLPVWVCQAIIPTSLDLKHSVRPFRLRATLVGRRCRCLHSNPNPNTYAIVRKPSTPTEPDVPLRLYSLILNSS